MRPEELNTGDAVEIDPGTDLDTEATGDDSPIPGENPDSDAGST